MKKLFFCLICLLSIFLFSCASNDIEPVETNESLESDEVISLEETEDKAIFPLPEAILEPEIITLAPPEDPEPVVKSEDEEKKEDAPEPELIIVEEPAPIVVPEKNEDNISNSTVKENITNITSSEDEKQESNLTNDDDQHPEDGGAEETPAVEEVSKDVSKEESEKSSDEVSKEAQEDDIVEQENEETEESITPSRSVTLKLKEYVDITYPGSGWIYMGATDGSKNLTYFGRGLGSKDTTFSLQARHPGTKILHFYKNDHLTNEYLDDYIEVVILDETGSNKTHIAAPKYKQPVPKKAKEMFYEQKATIPEEDQVIVIAEEDEVEVINDESESNKKADDINTTNTEEKTETKEEKTVITDPNTLLKEAQLLYNEKEFKMADEKINIFLKNATKKIDEGLYLKGQILEAKSEIQNIKNAIAAYETLTKEFPASKYWDAAKKRIVYLKRFYLEVR